MYLYKVTRYTGIVIELNYENSPENSPQNCPKNSPESRIVVHLS